MGTGATSLGDDGCDLRGGAAGLFALERHRQLRHVRVDAGPADPGVGQQRVEPADPPPTDPAVKGVAADPHALTGRAEVVPLGQRADQRAALAGAQRGVGGLADQRIAKQRDGLAAVICWRHGGSLPVGRPSRQWAAVRRRACRATTATGRARWCCTTAVRRWPRGELERPGVRAEPTCGSHRRDPDRLHRARQRRPARLGTATPGSSQAASLAKCPAISSARAANRRSQPRTVVAGTSGSTAIGR
jgi:hypothetical protein